MSLNKVPDTNYEAQQVALALQEYIEAANAEQIARANYEGHSWDYFGHSYISNRDNAANTFANKLNDYVDARIAASLEKRNGGGK